MSQTAYPSAPQNAPSDGQLGRVPYRGTAPWGEPPAYDELSAGVPPDASSIELSPAEDLHRRINLAYGHDALQLDYYLDQQYGAPPPGAPNQQPFQSGHTQVTVHNQSAEQGWGADPAFAWPRYPHMENHARAYNWGTARRNGGYLAPKDFRRITAGMQQSRDLLLSPIVTHLGPHGTVVRDAATAPYTYSVQQVSQSYAPAPIGAEGVLPG